MFIDRGFSKVIGQINERKQSHACQENGVNNYDEQEEVSHLVARVISDWHLSRVCTKTRGENEVHGNQILSFMIGSMVIAVSSLVAFGVHVTFN
jgi:hypothetical protein